MPKVEIDTPGVTIRLDASEASVAELSKQALELFREASEVETRQSSGPAFGFSNEKRWTADHHDTHYNGSRGFAPVKGITGHSGGTT